MTIFSSRSRLILVAVVLSVPFLAAAYSSPGKPTGHINDFANILPDDEQGELEIQLQQFKIETSNEIAIVTIPSLNGETIENYAVQLFEEWGVGQASKDNGVLIVVAPNERETRIEVGYGLEGALTDAQSYWIIQNEMLPAFREGDYIGGVRQAASEVMKAARGEYVPAADDTNNLQIPGDFGNLFDWVWIVFFIPVWLASILARSKSWWAGGIVGGLIGIVLGFIFGFLYFGVTALIVLIPLGFLFDYFVSRGYSKAKTTGHYPWWIGGKGGSGGSSGSGGGFGGFSGGSSGGGGASGSW